MSLHLLGWQQQLIKSLLIKCIRMDGGRSTYIIYCLWYSYLESEICCLNHSATICSIYYSDILVIFKSRNNNESTVNFVFKYNLTCAPLVALHISKHQTIILITLFCFVLARILGTTNPTAATILSLKSSFCCICFSEFTMWNESSGAMSGLFDDHAIGPFLLVYPLGNQKCKVV